MGIVGKIDLCFSLRTDLGIYMYALYIAEQGAKPKGIFVVLEKFFIMINNGVSGQF